MASTFARGTRGRALRRRWRPAATRAGAAGESTIAAQDGQHDRRGRQQAAKLVDARAHRSASAIRRAFHCSTCSATMNPPSAAATTTRIIDPLSMPSARVERHGAARAALIEPRHGGEREPRREHAGEESADHDEPVAAPGRRRDARRARTQSRERDPGAEHQAADELRQHERLRHVHARQIEHARARDSQKRPSIAVTIALNITLNTVRSVR